MNNEWTKLSPEEKRQTRFNQFLNPPMVKFVSPEAEKAFKVRAQRLIDVYNVKQPDQVPVSIPAGTMPAYLYGIDYKTAMYDFNKAAEAWTKFNDDFKLDYFASPVLTLPGKIYDLIDYKLYAWPGHGMPDNAIGYQFVEGEYMMVDEYDLLLKDPTGFFLRVYIPRVFGAFGANRMLPNPVSTVELPVFYFMPYMFQPLQAAQQRFIDIGNEIARWMGYIGEFSAKRMALGYPPSFSGIIIKAPFDTLGDTLRGTRGIMTDMYRQPDKVLKAMDVLADMTIDYATSSLNATKGMIAFFPLHKGADGWMSQKQFDIFYWPSLRKIINELLKEGILVSLFAEGAFNTRLECVNEFPKGAIHWIFDRTDMTKAKKILGNKCSMSGNVPSSMLVAGMPGEVKEYCRKLIEVCGENGGYMLSSGTADVPEAKPENFRAMLEAGREYGVYR
jgi:hypothetical protein